MGDFQSQAGPSSATLSDGSSRKENPSKIISNLYWGIAQFWYLVLCKGPWPFSFDFVAPKTENLSVHETIDSTTEPKPGSDAKNEQDCWDEVRAHLGRMHAGFSLWKVGIPDSYLDGLLGSEIDNHRLLGKLVVDALLGLAVTLTTAVDQTAVVSDLPQDRSKAYSPHLAQFMEEASKNTTEHYDHTRKSPLAVTTTNELLARLQPDLEQLLKLELSIKLANN